MQQSNGYIIGFAVAMTVILGGLLAFTAVSLKPEQEKQVLLDTKKQILTAVGITGEDKAKLAEIFDKQVKAIVVNVEGDEVSYDGEILKISSKTEYKKKDKAAKLLPVYKLMSEAGDKVETYVFPVYGYGLWNDIWGYVALEPDMNTVKGVIFAHKGETPGLGARISDESIQDRYKGKKIYKGTDLVAVDMLKGEGNANINDNQVDGMSGATLTAKGLNSMLVDYLGMYEAYMKKQKGTAAVSMN